MDNQPFIRDFPEQLTRFPPRLISAIEDRLVDLVKGLLHPLPDGRGNIHHLGLALLRHLTVRRGPQLKAK